MITAEIIKDSHNGSTHGRLTTFLLTYPRFIHSEFMTHRCFSRNAASSRAIPMHKMQRNIVDKLAEPIFWGTEERGMQASEALSALLTLTARDSWRRACGMAIAGATSLHRLGVHKQIANRVLEPFSHITVIATASERGLRNFFGLRAHKDAQPEFQVLAYAILNCWLNNEPVQLTAGDWHTPFDNDIPDEFPSGVCFCGNSVMGACDEHDFKDMSYRKDSEMILRICTGRIARVSYLTHDGIRDTDKDIELHDKLMKSGHWSPFEHCAQADIEGDGGNFGRGWQQYRKQFQTENQTLTNDDLRLRLLNRPEWSKV